MIFNSFHQVTLLLPVLLTASLCAPVEVKAATQCQASLRSIKNEVERSHGGRVAQAFVTSKTRVLPFKEDIALSRPSPLPGRPQFAIILLDGEYTPNTQIMSDKSLLRTFAQTILQGCSDVASVKFNWMWWTEGFSLLKSGQLVTDKCIHPSERATGPRWGENLCKY